MSPDNPMASFSAARPATPHESTQRVFPEFGSVFDSTISPSLAPTHSKAVTGAFPREEMHVTSASPTRRTLVDRGPARPINHPTRSAKVGCMLDPSIICRGVDVGPAPPKRETRGPDFAHHPFWGKAGEHYVGDHAARPWGDA